MEEGFYYVDAAGKRQGPFGINQLRRLISLTHWFGQKA